ncbi:hypothetical protein LIA77_08953 [Sarocladium implicatum]|nr:hypothetical protein LIA77_08953 [Sarocladium implicatum]
MQSSHASSGLPRHTSDLLLSAVICYWATFPLIGTSHPLSTIHSYPPSVPFQLLHLVACSFVTCASLILSLASLPSRPSVLQMVYPLPGRRRAIPPFLFIPSTIVPVHAGSDSSSFPLLAHIAVFGRMPIIGSMPEQTYAAARRMFPSCLALVSSQRNPLKPNSHDGSP